MKRRSALIALFTGTGLALASAWAVVPAANAAADPCRCVDCACPECYGELCTCDVCECGECACIRPEGEATPSA